MSSVASSVIGHAPCSVEIVRRKQTKKRVTKGRADCCAIVDSSSQAQLPTHDIGGRFHVPQLHRPKIFLRLNLVLISAGVICILIIGVTA